ncbi:MAG: hypothetical protein IT450_11055 [Phycisphaerales bacterium]|nr:hypothetical protein [Phycisphaerales bacterium]
MKTISNANTELHCAARWPIGGIWRILAIVLAFAAPSRAADENRADITPDPAFQTAIASIVTAEDGRRPAAIDRVIELGRASRGELVRQLVYFASRAKGTEDAMVVSVVLRRADVPDDTVAGALVPCLESSDAAVVKSVRSALGGLEKRAPGRRPDFSVYHGLIEERIRAGDPLPVGLVRYLYATDPGMALLTLMRAHQLRKPAEIKTILWAEHVVADVLWKQQYGFLKPSEIEPAAAAELTALVRHNAWWARLYVAEVMRQHAPFRRDEPLKILSHDANDLVRESATAALGAP